VVLAGGAGDSPPPRHHRPDAVRAHLLDRLGDHEAAREHFRRAARATLNLAEKRYLEDRARRAGSAATTPPDDDPGTS
jgi:predicted RNA polymerase sigma factor